MEGRLLCVKVLSNRWRSWKQMRWSGKKTKRLYTAGWQSLLLIASHLVGNLGCSDRFRHRFAIKRVLARRKSMLVCSVAFSFCAFLSLHIYIYIFSSSSSSLFFFPYVFIYYLLVFFFFGGGFHWMLLGPILPISPCRNLNDGYWVGFSC